MASSREPLTELLAAVGRGDDAARERLWAVIYDELDPDISIQVEYSP